MSLNSFSASSHCPAFSHAEMREEYVMTLRSQRLRTISSYTSSTWGGVGREGAGRGQGRMRWSREGREEWEVLGSFACSGFRLNIHGFPQTDQTRHRSLQPAGNSRLHTSRHICRPQRRHMQHRAACSSTQVSLLGRTQCWSKHAGLNILVIAAAQSWHSQSRRPPMPPLPDTCCPHPRGQTLRRPWSTHEAGGVQEGPKWGQVYLFELPDLAVG